MASLQRNMTLIHVINQVRGDEELLNTSRDCFHFATTFFEPIDVSATHIYHSALELSPLSSIVRRLHYHRRHIPLPRVVVGTMSSWYDGISISSARSALHPKPSTWSQCGQFVATGYLGVVEIRDPLISELLSTLLSPSPIRALAYSPDGRSLATLSFNSLIIWDIQTGGAAKEVECVGTEMSPLVWSLDGRAIATTLRGAVQVYDVDLGTIKSLGTFQSSDKPCLWAHDKAFRVMTTGWDGEARTVDIFEAGSVLTKIESFRVGSPGQYDPILSFSPATYRISMDLSRDRLCILDIRNSKSLLEADRGFSSHSFSSDGSLFAGSIQSSVWIWKYDSGRYTLWRTLSVQSVEPPSHLQFSPASSSIMGLFPGVLQVWRLDGPPIVTHPDRDKPLGALPSRGTYVATSLWGRTTVTITNLLSQAPSQFIDTGMEVWGLAIIGNVLLVMGHEMETIAAWRLTEEGVVDGPLGDRSAGCSSSIWTIPVLRPTVSIGERTAVIQSGVNVTHFDKETGEVLGSAQAHPDLFPGSYSLAGLKAGQGNSFRSNFPPGWMLFPLATPEERWLKDSEGRHLLWIPPAWRLQSRLVDWPRDRTAVWLGSQSTTVVEF